MSNNDYNEIPEMTFAEPEEVYKDEFKEVTGNDETTRMTITAEEKKIQEEKKMKEKIMFTITGKETEDERLEVTSSVSKELLVQGLELLKSFGEGETRAAEINAEKEKNEFRNRASFEVLNKLMRYLS